MKPRDAGCWRRWRCAEQGDGRPLLDSADTIRREYESSGLTQGAFMAVYCADSAAWWQGLSSPAVADLAQQVQALAPRLGAWLWSPPAAPELPPVGLCAMQPPGTSVPPVPIDAAGAGPVLVLASSGDPTTPVSSARRALRDLDDAVLLIVDADHHLAYQYALADPMQPAYHCVLDAVEAYLIARVAPTQTRCPDVQPTASPLAWRM